MNSLELLALTHALELPPSRDQPTASDWANVLASFPLFTHVSKRRLRKLARKATLAEIPAGETILFAGDHGNSLYIILGGRAKTRSTPTGRALHTGDYFGELALIDGHPRSATVVATSDVHVMKLPSHSVLELTRQHPAITLTMLQNLTTQLRRLETQRTRTA